MVITFNCKEGTKTITFAELQEAISDKNGSDLDCLAAPSCKASAFETRLVLFAFPVLPRCSLTLCCKTRHKKYPYIPDWDVCAFLWVYDNCKQ